MTYLIIEVRPDHGGKDAEDFASELATSFYKYCQKNSIPVELQPASGANKAYVLKAQAKVRALKWMEGVHTVTRIPKGSSSRHTSSATVVVIDPQKAEVSEGEINDNDLRIDRYRGTGSGGQRKNKVSTAVRLVHVPTGITITRETGRSQIDNLESAKEQLRIELRGLAKKARKEEIDAQRNILEDRSRSFTHNYQRGEVVDHSSGKRWTIKQWNSGKMRVGK